MLPLTGSFSEYIVVPYSNIVKFDNDKFAEMASLPLVGLTCIQALKYEHGL
jgi:NADPH:quinone reductase-like Zn-dependent oxidoreductase